MSSPPPRTKQFAGSRRKRKLHLLCDRTERLVRHGDHQHLDGTLPTHPFLGVPPAENDLSRRVAVSRQTVRSKTQLKLARGQNLRQHLFFENLTYRFRRDFVGDPLNKEFGIHYGIGCPYTLQKPKRLDTEAKDLILPSFIFAFSLNCGHLSRIRRFPNEHHI